jgi:hypothetical protein
MRYRVHTLKANLKLHGFEEIALLLIVRVVKKLLDVGAHSSWRNGQKDDL